MNSLINARQQLLASARIRGWEPLLWLVAFVLPFALPGHALIVNEVAIVALFAVSLDLVLGYTGIVSLGHAAFLGLGAYASALFAKHVMPDPLAGLIFGTFCATLLGAVCSLTILRGTDLTRLMVTLGMALILMELANKLDWLTGGSDGLQGVMMGPVLGRFEFDLYGQTAAWYSLTVLLARFVLARRSRLLFLDARLAQSIAPAVAAIMQEETGRSPELDAFLDLAEQYATVPVQ